MITPIGTLSYPALFTPDRYEGTGPERYKCEIIFDRDDADLTEINKALVDAVQKRWPDPASRPSGIMDRWPIKTSGEGVKSLRAATRHRPRVFDTSMNEITDEGLMYAGCVVRLAGFVHTYGSGVTFILKEVLRVADGEPLTGEYESEFAGLYGDNSPSAPQGQTQSVPGEFSGNAGTTSDPLNDLLVQ